MKVASQCGLHLLTFTYFYLLFLTFNLLFNNIMDESRLTIAGYTNAFNPRTRRTLFHARAHKPTRTHTHTHTRTSEHTCARAHARTSEDSWAHSGASPCHRLHCARQAPSLVLAFSHPPTEWESIDQSKPTRTERPGAHGARERQDCSHPPVQQASAAPYECALV